MNRVTSGGKPRELSSSSLNRWLPVSAEYRVCREESMRVAVRCQLVRCGAVQCKMVQCDAVRCGTLPCVLRVHCMRCMCACESLHLHINHASMSVVAGAALQPQRAIGWHDFAIWRSQDEARLDVLVG